MFWNHCLTFFLFYYDLPSNQVFRIKLTKINKVKTKYTSFKITLNLLIKNAQFNSESQKLLFSIPIPVVVNNFLWHVFEYFLVIFVRVIGKYTLQFKYLQLLYWQVTTYMVTTKIEPKPQNLQNKNTKSPGWRVLFLYFTSYLKLLVLCR